MDGFDLGKHTKTISTSSAEAQHYFNLGLKWCYAFNQEEGVKCFKRALDYDSACAMAHWGVAYAAGPFYNYTWIDMSPAEAARTTQRCFEHVAIAYRLAANTNHLEQQLINALSQRFQKPHPVPIEEFNTWDDAYADAMRVVYHRVCANDEAVDHDVMALFAESLMTRTPWKLWDVKQGIPPAGADTYEALEVIERSIKLNTLAGNTQHPAILHLHIHATEMSTQPERAMQSAERLGSLCPDAGHLLHMPAHVFVLCGQYEKARRCSEMAIAADDKYLDYAGPFNFYTTARCHDLHLMMYTCMLMGQFAPAMKAAEKMCSTLSKAVLNMPEQPQMTTTMEGYYSMKMHVLVRFGQWQTIIDTDLPDDPVLYCVSTAMHHYAKGVAYATLKQATKAEEERALFKEALKRIPKQRCFFNNPASDILVIAMHMLDGEMAYHLGQHDKAFAVLRMAVMCNDNLEYNEPWAWMHPPRHALAALLSEQGRFDEAEDVHRTDLGLNDKLQRCAQHPDNVWALHGLVECLKQRGDTHELAVMEKKLALAQARTDFDISSSCLCRGM